MTTPQRPAQFNRAPTAAAPVQPPKVKEAPPSIYAGIQASGDRNPPPEPGQYWWEIVKFEEGQFIQQISRMTNKLELKVTHVVQQQKDSNVVDDVVFVSFQVVGSGANAGRGRMKTFCVAACGFEHEAEFDAWATKAGKCTNTADPAEINKAIARVIECLLGYSHEGVDVAPLVGCAVGGRVTLGSAMVDKETKQPTGDYYRNIAWIPVPAEPAPAAA